MHDPETTGGHSLIQPGQNAKWSEECVDNQAGAGAHRNATGKESANRDGCRTAHLRQGQEVCGSDKEMAMEARHPQTLAAPDSHHRLPPCMQVLSAFRWDGVEGSVGGKSLHQTAHHAHGHDSIYPSHITDIGRSVVLLEAEVTAQGTCGACEVVHDLVGELDAVLLPVERRVVVQLAAGVLGQRAYGGQVGVLPAACSTQSSSACIWYSHVYWVRRRASRFVQMFLATYVSQRLTAFCTAHAEENLI